MDPLLVAFIVLVVVLVFLVSLAKTPQGRGFLGEWYIKHIIGKTVKGKQYVINNYMIVEDGKSSQIDHILINSKGIFIIETKNYSGRIYGKENQQEWTQVLNYGKVKNHFYNPVKQNATHVYRITNILPEDAPIISVVVFVKDNTKYIESEKVIGSSRLGKFVKNDHGYSLTEDQMESYYKTLTENRSDLSNREHVKEIHQMKQDIDSNICPRCGGKLVEKTGKYGKFLGCENYPKCKFIKKL